MHPGGRSDDESKVQAEQTKVVYHFLLKFNSRAY